MTLKAQILSDVTEVFFDEDDFAQTVLRYVGGDMGSVRQMTAVVTIDQVQVDDGRGRGFLYHATMILPSSTIIEKGDGVKIGDTRYEVERVSDVEHGMRTVHLMRYQPEVKGGKVFRNGDI